MTKTLQMVYQKPNTYCYCHMHIFNEYTNKKSAQDSKLPLTKKLIYQTNCLLSNKNKNLHLNICC